jgi:hypothetical protein
MLMKSEKLETTGSVPSQPHDSGELVVLRKADWTRVFGGLKLRPLYGGK